MRVKTSREAFEDTFRWEFRHNSRNWVDSQLLRINVGYVGAVAQSHWMTWQAACKWADGMED